MDTDFTGAHVPKVLLLDDDHAMALRIREWLEETCGFVVEVVHTAEDALRYLREFEFDLITINRISDMQGIEVCRRFRRRGGDTPILMLASGDEIDYLEDCFASGADDCLRTPFHFRELSARCVALLRRGRTIRMLSNAKKRIILQPDTNTLHVGDARLRLTRTECALLSHLMSHPGKHFSSADLLREVWPANRTSSPEAVRVLIRTLRKKLSQVNSDTAQEIIKTVPGGGYVYAP
ncbi:MAG TPA: response regulator transcription factor [Candidatus Obscuribacterales bacterium]